MRAFRRRSSVLVFFCLGLFGCASNPYDEPQPPMTEQAKAVKITTNQLMTTGCTLVGQIKMPPMKPFGRVPAEEDYYNIVKRKASDMGGNLVLDHAGLEAYKCPPGK